MAAQNHEWTLSEIGTSYGASSGDRHKTEGQEDIAFTVTARQDIANTNDGDTYNFSGAPGRVDVPNPCPPGCIPAPFAGESGTPLDFGAVAPDTAHPAIDLDGSGAPAASDTSAAAPGVPS